MRYYLTFHIINYKALILQSSWALFFHVV